MVFQKQQEYESYIMKDPVCGMEIDEKHDHIEHKGKKYYFCCASCRWAFEQNPDQFEQS